MVSVTSFRRHPSKSRGAGAESKVTAVSISSDRGVSLPSRPVQGEAFTACRPEEGDMSRDRSDTDSEPDAGRVQDRAVKRQRERAEHAENIYERVGGLLDEQKYPVSSEELAIEYGDTMLDMPNETESLGDVFDRLVDERFESSAEAREAAMNELTGEADGPSEYNEERALADLDADDGDDSPDR
jgi:hypothetical protein